MDNITKTLLSGAAISALAAVPAMAAGHAPNMHVAGARIASLNVKYLGSHYKTDIRDPKKVTHVTTDFTFTGTLHESTAYKHAVTLWKEGWFTRTGTTSASKCITAPNEKAKFKKTKHAKIKAVAVTGTVSIPTFCASNTGQTFYGPQYTLKDKNATSDSFTGTIVANEKKLSGYIFTIDATTNLTID
jgi:hypothetical protein